MHELEKVRKQLEVEKMELQSALEEAEVKGQTLPVLSSLSYSVLPYRGHPDPKTKVYWLPFLVEDHTPSNHDCLQS